MKKILDYANSIESEKSRLKGLYGLTYLQVDEDQLSATTETMSLNVWSWKDTPTIKPVCGNISPPETFEEFEKMKRVMDRDTFILEKVLQMWKRERKVDDMLQR